MSGRSIAWLALGLVTVGVGVAVSQSASPSRPRNAAPPAGGSRVSNDTETAPVPVPEPSAETLRYHRSGNLLWTLALVWSFLVPAAVLVTGLSARLRDTVRRLAGGRWGPTVIGYIVLYGLLVFVLDLPLAYYAGFVRPHAYDLSNQTLAQWAAELMTSLGVGLAIAVLFGWIPFLLIRRSPRRWWLWTGLGALPFLVFMVLVSPIWIDPLFNDYSRLRDAELEAEILELARRAGVDAERVWEVDKSADTERVNAYVTGLAGTHRIVLWDTLLAKLEPDETLFVMGHELGHYVLGHIRRGIVLGWLGIVACLYLVHHLARRCLDRFTDRFGISRLADVASLPLLVMLLQLVSFVASPAALAYSRWQEREADRFGLELTRNNDAAARAFVKLQRENLTHPRPGPIYRFFRLSHPPLAERIEFANDYRPPERGEERSALEVFEDRVEFSAVVDRTGFERSLLGLGMPGYHYVVWSGGSAAPAALFRASVSDRELLEALEELGLEPGDGLPMATWERRDDPEADAPERLIEGPPVEVLVRVAGRDELLSPDDILRDPGGRGFDMRFGGHEEHIERWRSGCVVCLYSCPGSKVGNRAYTVRDWIDQRTRFTVREGVLPPDGSEVTVLIRRR